MSDWMDERMSYQRNCYTVFNIQCSWINFTILLNVDTQCLKIDTVKFKIEKFINYKKNLIKCWYIYEVTPILYSIFLNNSNLHL